VAKFLSPEWLDLQHELAAGLPPRAGLDARVQYVVTGSPEGDVKYVTTFAAGALAANQPGPDPSAEVTLTIPYAEALEVATGRLDANVAFMQGRIKVEGAMAPFLALLPATQTDEYRAMQRRLAEATEA
jgi:putative sterol carrier protein